MLRFQAESPDVAATGHDSIPNQRRYILKTVAARAKVALSPVTFESLFASVALPHWQPSLALAISRSRLI